jgi:hypothetical protein
LYITFISNRSAHPAKQSGNMSPYCCTNPGCGTAQFAA